MKTIAMLALFIGLMTSAANAQTYGSAVTPAPDYFNPNVTMTHAQFDALIAKVAPRPTVTRTVVQKYVPTEAQIREAQQYRDKTDFAFWGLIVLLVCAISGLFWALAMRVMTPHHAAQAPTAVPPVILRPEVIRVTDTERFVYIASANTDDPKPASTTTPTT